MTAEGLHETGRAGVVMAKDFLWKVLGDAIDLPFNVYDHEPKLCFDAAGELDLGRFCFDLRGHIRRVGKGLDNREVAEVFVEVKQYEYGGSLLGMYEDFLRRAAFVAAREDHSTTWFIFLTTVPFGSSRGRELCDGRLLDACRSKWRTGGKPYGRGLEERISVIVATDSFRRLIDNWGSSERISGQHR